MCIFRPARRALVINAGWLALGAGGQTDPQTGPPIARELRVARNPDFTSVANSLVLQELYRRVGIQVTVVEMPPARAALEARQGRVDGEVLRIHSYADDLPQLLRVEPPLHQIGMAAAYRKGSAVRVRSPADLARYSVGYTRGVKYTEDLMRGMSRSVATDSPAQLVKMLQAGRVELVFHGTRAILKEIRALGLADEFDVTELASFPLYHYLHARHRELAPLIGAAIARATDSGELERLFTRYAKELPDAAVPTRP